MLSRILSGLCAGLIISIGGTVFLSCENRYVGAVLFCVALLCICFRGYSLFTGKVGFLPEKHGKEEYSVVFLGLFGNTVGTVLGGLAIRMALPDLGDKANLLCTAKLTQTVPQTLLRAFFCGILMYLAVSIYRDQKRITGILFCIPTFILCGFEHSIADMFYFAASGILSFRAFLFLLLVICGNAAGAILLPLLTQSKENKEKPNR